ncbi:S-adenosyl-L-methionine-dependent methyltransferase [Lasiosphaeris hirsuta]|uniref:S-adenosyl-L-methionine-dependent methyltransferase n=1 Tax=Lasiosphaeris hirsuta TaxID=260670 RepID=A0AA39ZRL8_9PEZI|nr:S-adenosyl-L-methionine-dependent methyltransferase [Lasiosphaeris hirsuta]
MADSQKEKSPSPTATPPAGTTGALEVDLEPYNENENDGDSAFTEGPGVSETASLASSIYKFREEHGRTYHAYKAGAYFLPNDENENDRLDLQHNLLILTQDNQLYVCPAGKDKSKPLRRVLDAGCGTGIWTQDFADEHPETEVVGVDLSPIQPSFVAPNVQFFVDDLEADWTFVNPFDFIYMRMLCGSIKDWPRLFAQALTHLAPGGYIELCDPINPMRSDDDSIPENSAALKWNRLLLDASHKLGRALDSPLHYKQQLANAGFTDVVQIEYKWPINSWPKDPKHKNVGLWTHENINQGLQALSLMLFTNVLGWTAEEVELLLVQVRKDLKNRKIHAYWPVYTVYGQKPTV